MKLAVFCPLCGHLRAPRVGTNICAACSIDMASGWPDDPTETLNEAPDSRAGQPMNPSGGAVDDAPAPYGLAQTTTPSPDGHTAGKADQQPTTGARASGPAGTLE